MAKEVKICKVSDLPEYAGVRFAFVGGETFDLNVSELAENIQKAALIHGLTQKGRDSYAGAKTVEEAKGLFSKVFDNLLKGEWTGRAEGGVREEPVELLAQALLNVQTAKGVKDLTLEGMLARVKATDPDKRRKIRAIPEVAVELAKLKAEKSKAAGSIEDLLGEAKQEEEKEAPAVS